MTTSTAAATSATAATSAPSAARRRGPIATYRLQLDARAGFVAAGEMLDHLMRLGVSHVYLSPVLQAVPGSPHGYDVIDPHHLDVERGGEQAFAALVGRAHALGLQVLLDVVPNHLAADSRNGAWADVLRHGRSSRFAGWFDLSWGSGTESVPDRLLLPILDRPVEDAIDAIDATEGGQVVLVHRAGEVQLRVGDQHLPLSDESVAELFVALGVSIDGTGRLGQVAARRRFAKLAADLAPRPATGATGAMAVDTVDTVAGWSHTAGDVHRLVSVLTAMVDDHPDIAEGLDVLLASASADPTLLAAVLGRQHYELAYWDEISRRLDRRRFFDVADLVGVRQEDPDVFAATHARVLAMCRQGEVDGLRIDHLDGLADPGDYLARLRTEIGDRWLIVEKILASDEQLPESWPVDGTTGYERAAVIDRLFVDPAGEEPLTALVRRVAPGEAVDPAVVMEQGKRDVLRMLFTPELRALTGLAARVIGPGAAAEPLEPIDAGDDPELRSLITELVVAAPVYRTYVQRGRAAEPVDGAVLDAIWHQVDARVGATQGGRRSEVLRAVFDRAERSDTEEAFVVRFQQLTGAVIAKGVEDTAFYRLPRLAALCEVGADPAVWSLGARDFHEHQTRWLSRWPAGMVAMSTHDSKRSADARARLLVLSEVPQLWAETVERLRARFDEVIGTDRRDPLLDLLLIQSAVAIHPVSADRLSAAAVKAAREAKRATSWLHPDGRAEEQVVAIARLLADDAVCADALAPLLEAVVPAGRTAAVAIAMISCLGGGVPDLYQGSLGWQLALADPDNRTPVDQVAERSLLADAETHGARLWREVVTPTDERGVTKAHALRTCLAVRREFAAAAHGEATPIAAAGAGVDHVVAWSLAPDVLDPPDVVVVVGRLRTALAREGGWRDTRVDLPPGTWRDALLGTGAGADAHAHAEQWAGTVDLDGLIGDRAGAILLRR